MKKLDLYYVYLKRCRLVKVKARHLLDAEFKAKKQCKKGELVAYAESEKQTLGLDKNEKRKK